MRLLLRLIVEQEEPWGAAMEDVSDENRWAELSETGVSLWRGWAFKVQPGWGGEFLLWENLFEIGHTYTLSALSELLDWQ